MNTKYVLYNPLAGSMSGNKEKMNKLKDEFAAENAVYMDITKLEDYADFINYMDESDEIILCGGDGTINKFINYTDGLNIKSDIFYYPIGTGNDFMKEIEADCKGMLVRINDYIKNLPKVTVKGTQYRFLNGVGYGIDGYCCEVGDAMKVKSDKPVNYTMIAIKGLLHGYKPTNAKITVDGKTYEYEKVWLAPTMHGLYYGGGMMPAPEQKRTNTDGKVSLMTIHGSGKLKTLMVFPGIFKGEHVKHKEMTAIHSGHNIKVEFDRPVALQIDGETILGVTEYEVTTAHS